MTVPKVWSCLQARSRAARTLTGVRTSCSRTRAAGSCASPLLTPMLPRAGHTAHCSLVRDRSPDRGTDDVSSRRAGDAQKCDREQSASCASGASKRIRVHGVHAARSSYHDTSTSSNGPLLTWGKLMTLVRSKSGTWERPSGQIDTAAGWADLEFQTAETVCYRRQSTVPAAIYLLAAPTVFCLAMLALVLTLTMPVTTRVI